MTATPERPSRWHAPRPTLPPGPRRCWEPPLGGRTLPRSGPASWLLAEEEEEEGEVAEEEGEEAKEEEAAATMRDAPLLLLLLLLRSRFASPLRS